MKIKDRSYRYKINRPRSRRCPDNCHRGKLPPVRVRVWVRVRVRVGGDFPQGNCSRTGLDTDMNTLYMRSVSV